PDDEVVAARKNSVHKHGGRLPAREIERQGEESRLGWNDCRPFREVACNAPELGVGEQQDALTRYLQTDPIVDESREPRSALTTEYFGQPLGIRSQDLRTTLLNGHLPPIPQGCSNQNERRNSKGDVTERQCKGRGSQQLIHRPSTCSRHCGPCAATAAPSRIRSSGAAC